MSFDSQKNKTPNLKLVTPNVASEQTNTELSCEMLLSSSIADFIEGDMGQAMTGIRALTAYAESWPDECPNLGVRLHACELAFKSWQSGCDLEALGELFWAGRQLTGREETEELRYFVFDAVAHNLMHRRMYSDMREQLAWARTWETTPGSELLVLAYELILSTQQSGAAGASEGLVSKLSKAVYAPCSFEQFKSWFPLYVSGIALAQYHLEAGNLRLARQHASGARNMALLANALLLEVRALEIEALIACEAKQPMAMYDARTDIYKISSILGFTVATEPPKSLPRSVRISELPSTVSLNSGMLGTDDSTQVLTKRERSVLKRVQYGDRNKEIAKTLNITEDTVKYHLKNIFSKLGVSKRVQAVRIAQEQGYISLFI